jgi:hypothetical protein
VGFSGGSQVTEPPFERNARGCARDIPLDQCDQSRMLDATFGGCAAARQLLLSSVWLEIEHRCGLMFREA